MHDWDALIRSLTLQSFHGCCVFRPGDSYVKVRCKLEQPPYRVALFSAACEQDRTWNEHDRTSPE